MSVSKLGWSLLLAVGGCQVAPVQSDWERGDAVANPSHASTLEDVTPAEWEALAKRRIFFGHQSVGRNIVDGLVDLLQEHREIPFMVAEARNFGAHPAFYHATVGRNQYPQEKIEELSSIVTRSLGTDSGVAALKFCYADLGPDSDAAALFQLYQERIEALKAAHPDLQVVHFTVPLTRSESWKGVVKKRITRKPLLRDANVVRSHYNRLLVEAYGGHEPVFDIARIESTLPDGRRMFFMHDGDTVYTLVPQHAADAGHLNADGRRLVAERLLVLLAKELS